MAKDSFEEELAQVPTARKGPPRWMIFMGCGCLIPGFILVATAAWFIQLYSGLVNKDAAWKSLSEVIAYDEAARGTPNGLEDNPKTPADESREPGEFELLMGGDVPFSGGVEAYWFGRGLPLPTDKDQTFGPDPLSITLLKIDSEQSDKATMAPAGTPLHEDRTYEIRGKTFRGRVVPEMVNDQLSVQVTGLDEVRGAGTVLWLREQFSDPDEPDTTFDLLAFFQRPGSSVPIRDDEVSSFLEPFDLETFPKSAEAADETSDEDK